MATVMVCFAGVARAEIDTRGAAIRLELIAEVRSIQPGQPFRVGLRIHHEPGWHTYWRQPGIVGVPVTLTWTLPAGFSAGPIQWPAPERVKMGALTAWGFEKDVLLMVDITPPAQLAPGSTVPLRAKGAWMACARTCHPGWGDFEISLPVQDGAVPDRAPEHRPLFTAATEALPRELLGWEATVRTGADGKHRLRLQPSQAGIAVPAQANWYFYPYTPHVHSDEPQKVALLPGGGVELTLSPFPIPEPPADRLEGVIECSALPPGSPRGVFVIHAPWKRHPLPHNAP
jgi:thiol:disulfide interchange protein DsbD